jgi:hypothetical protein
MGVNSNQMNPARSNPRLAEFMSGVAKRVFPNMKDTTKRSIIRAIHIIFGLPIFGYIYGPPEEVAPYVSMFRYVFVPVLVLSGLWMWNGHAIRCFFSKPENK